MLGIASISAPAETLIVFIHDAFASHPVVSSLAIGVPAIIVLLSKLHLISPRVDAQEPPVLKPRIPFIGHLIGLIRQNAEYYFYLRKRTSEGIVTLPIFASKNYIIWDPFLAHAAMKHRTLSFYPFADIAQERVVGVPGKVTHQWYADIGMDFEGFLDHIYRFLSGKPLDEMNKNALAVMAAKLDGIGGDWVDVPDVSLWIRDIVSEATTRALFGKHNPFEKDPSLVDDLWTFEASLSTVMFSPFPKLTHPAFLASRDRMANAMRDFMEQEHDKDPSVAEIIKYRVDAQRRGGLAQTEWSGLAEITFPFVGTTNTSPTTFWMLLSILRSPGLVERLREEIQDFASPDDSGVCTFEINKLEERCPLLVSCWREVLRRNNLHVVNRIVTEDTILSSPASGREYLLKKGAAIQMAAGVAHLDTDVWGVDADDFNPDRFMASNMRGGKGGAERTKRAAYIPFGGGRHLCPGRHLAFAEVLGFLAMLVLGYDIVDSRGKTEFQNIKRMDPVLSGAVLKAAGEESMKIRRRKGWEGVRWQFVSN